MNLQNTLQAIEEAPKMLEEASNTVYCMLEDAEKINAWLQSLGKTFGEPSAGIIWTFACSGRPELADVAVDQVSLDTRIWDIAENCTRRLVGLRLDATLAAKSAWMTDVAIVRDSVDRRPKQWWQKPAATEQKVHTCVSFWGFWTVLAQMPQPLTLS